MNIFKLRQLLVALLSLALNFTPSISLAQDQNELSLEQAISRALTDDDWIIANKQIELSLSEESISAGQLPDPRMSIGLSNMPLDTFNFNQELSFESVSIRLFPAAIRWNYNSVRKRSKVK
jgi:hypothetical protein